MAQLPPCEPPTLDALGHGSDSSRRASGGEEAAGPSFPVTFILRLEGKLRLLTERLESQCGEYTLPVLFAAGGALGSVAAAVAYKRRLSAASQGRVSEASAKLGLRLPAQRAPPLQPRNPCVAAQPSSGLQLENHQLPLSSPFGAEPPSALSVFTPSEIATLFLLPFAVVGATLLVGWTSFKTACGLQGFSHFIEAARWTAGVAPPPKRKKEKVTEDSA